MAAGRFDEAASLYTAIVQALPNEPGMRLNLGMALSMAGQPREAVPHLQAALKLQPDLLPASLFLGAAQMELGQPAQAVEPLQRFVTAQPDHRDAPADAGGAALCRSSATSRPRASTGRSRSRARRTRRRGTAWGGATRAFPGAPSRRFRPRRRTPSFSCCSSPRAWWPRSATRALSPSIARRSRRSPGSPRPTRPWRRSTSGAATRTGPRWSATRRRALPPPDCRAASLECDFRAGRYRGSSMRPGRCGRAESRYWVSRAAGELAREAFTRLDALPPSPEALLVRVDVLRGQRRYAGVPGGAAEGDLGAGRTTCGSAASWRRLHFIAHEYAAARPLLEDLLKHEPDSAELNLLLGEAWLESKEPSKAIPSPREGGSRGPEAPPRPGRPGPRVRRGRTGRARRPSPGGRPADGRGRQPALPARPRVPRDRPGRRGDPDPRGLPGDPPGERGPAEERRKRSSRSRRPEPGSFTRPRRLPK